MSRLPITLLSPDPNAPFPTAERALREPNGLLAAGGDLSPVRLLNAYRHGIFPWFSPDQPILWWSPDPRIVFATDGVKLSSRFRRQMAKSTWTLRADTAFDQVISACANAPRAGQHGTWITHEMIMAYREMHRLGHAHSVEIFDGQRLIGGIYGIAIGHMFFGESMFSAEPGGSKLALAGLAQILRRWSWPLIDAQVENEHLLFMGGQRMPRPAFLQEITALTSHSTAAGLWTETIGTLPVSHLF